MSIEQLLSELRTQGFKLWTENGRLLFRAPPGLMTPEVRERLKQHKTELVELLSNVRRPLPVEREVGVTRPLDEPIPLSFAQQRLWFLEQLEPGAGRYNVPIAFKVIGRLQVAMLEDALNRIIERHAVLRTTFVTQSEQPLQQVHPALSVSIEVEELGDVPPTEREAVLRRRLREEAVRPFDLEHGPLLRALLLRLDSDEHVLLLNIHHIVSDGWSMAVLNRELSACYAAFVGGKEPELPVLSLQYADYSRWQHSHLQGDELQRQLDYWKSRLAELPQLGLATDKPRPAYLGSEGGNVQFVVPRELRDSLVTLSRQNGVTPFMVFLAAFAVLLHRYSGQTDVAIGTPIAGRTRANLEDLIGFFVNTLVMRADLSGDPSFSEVLRRVRGIALEAYEHQDLPFEKLVEELAPARDTSRNPLFQVMLAFQNVPENPLELAGLEVSRFPFECHNNKFDLSLTLRDSANGLLGNFNYNTDLFEAETIERLSRHYWQLLESIVVEPDRAIAALPLLTDPERQQILHEWNSTDVHFPQDLCIHELFEARAEQTPDATALTFEETQLTYDDLNRRSNQLARYLQNLGVRPGDLIGLCLERSSEIIIGILGILKAGAAYVPLDPTVPAARMHFILTDSQAPILLTQQSLVAMTSSYQGRVICVDAERPTIARERAANPANTTTGRDLAYVIYTSGSTGKPKGVRTTHANVVRLFAATEACYHFNQSDVWTLFHSYAFDFSVWEIWGALLYGGRLVIVPYWISRSPEDFYTLLIAEQVTVVNQTPSAFRQLIRAEDSVGVSNDLALRHVIFGGEALEMNALKPWFDRHGDQNPQLVNMYGITETTVHVTYRPLSITDLTAGSVVGRPIPDLQVYILDGQQELVPIGVPGEMYIGGAGVSPGYLDLPKLTRERFIRNPFKANSNARLYRSGDVARYLPDGDIEYLGRIDDQIQLRGFRIELGEIEAILSSHPDVREVCVTAGEDVFGDKRLVAYVVREREAETDNPSLLNGKHQSQTADLRQHGRTHLPDYMVPSAFVVLDALPLNANGKIDRNALPMPDEAPSESTENFAPPEGVVEETLAKIWQDMLELESVGRYDNFFDLGGHSLLAVRVVNLISRQWGVNIALRRLFERPTITSLADEIEQLRKIDRFDSPGGLCSQYALNADMSRLRHDPAFLSFAQQRLWFLEQLEPGAGWYNIPIAFKVIGRLQVAMLEDALNRIIERHAVLRTTFVTQSEQPLQQVHPALSVSIEVEELGDVPPTEREAVLRRRLREEAVRPFDLEHGPLLRALLLRLDSDEHVLLLNIHHIVSDGWSMAVLNRELSACYAAFVGGKEPELPVLSLQYADYSRWQHSHLQGDELQRQLDYWKSRLAELPQLGLATDKPRPAYLGSEGGNVQFVVPRELRDSLVTLSRQNGVTPFMVFLAAFAVLLHRYSGQTDVAIGTPIAGRTRANLEDLIGFFVNTLVMRADLSGDPSFSEVLRRVRGIALEAYEHQDLPFEKLVEELAPARDTSRNPLFQVMLAFQNVPENPLELAGLEVSRIQFDWHTSKFDLLLTLNESREGLAGNFNYNTDLFEAETIERMSEHYRLLLASIAADPSQSIHALSLLSDDERKTLLVDWNATAQPYDNYVCIHTLIEQQADRGPDRTAVVYGGRAQSYQELNESANRLAHYLIESGVGPEDVVGIHLERTPGMLVAMLAILKAGGAYMPLDPSYPVERLTYMLEDSAAKIVLSSWSQQARLPRQTACEVLELEALERLLPAYPISDPGLAGTRGQLACVLYTSGSTGRPKGVMIEHAALSAFVNWFLDAFSDEERAQVLASTSMNFDMSILELLGTLAGGGHMVLVNDVLRLAELADASQISLIIAVPSALRELLTLQAIPNSVRAICSAGEPLSTSLVDGLYAKTAIERVVDAYGPTEATVVTQEVRQPAAVETIGRPRANVSIYILSAGLIPVPVGVPGEVFIAGEGLARGYLNQPQLTAERFVDVDFGRFGSARCYRTGDLAKYLPDGRIVLLGRLDHQIKIRGHRVEIGEIEATLLSYAGVHQALVIERKDSSENNELIAYVESDGLDNNCNEVFELLRRRLPTYMVPAQILVLERFPLLPNGKVDRSRLPQPGERRPTAEFEAPVTETERRLAEIWCELLGVERVGRHDDFFESGGHSLLAVRVVNRINREFAVTLTIRALFDQSTLRGLANEIEELKASDCVSGAGEPRDLIPAIPRVARKDPDTSA